MKAAETSQSKSSAVETAEEGPDTPIGTERSASVLSPGQATEGPSNGPAPEPKAIGRVAVLELGEGGKILGARDACLALLGWGTRELVGKNISVLLKDGLDNEVGRFLQRHREGANPTGTGTLRVVAVRKDGIEFPAQIKTVTWSCDKAPVETRVSSRLSWTAAIQSLAEEWPPARASEPSAAPVSPSPKSSPPRMVPRSGPPASMPSAGKPNSKSPALEALVADLVSSATNDAKTTLSRPARVTEGPPAGAAPAPATISHVAVLELGDGGEILGAQDACLALFGREARALVGKNIRILLKDGLDNEVGRFLQRHREGVNPTGTGTLRVVALHKDGTEYPAQVTTRHWSWDKSPTDSKATSRLRWTVAIESLTGQRAFAPAPAKIEAPASPLPKSSPPREAPLAAPPAVMQKAGKPKWKTSALDALAADLVWSATSDGTPTLSPPAQVTEGPLAEAAPGPALIDHVAVLELGDGGEILGARDACLDLFGREAKALVGKNIRILLKDGLDNEVGRFLQRHREGTNPTETGPLRVVALRKDGSEFPAQVTTRHWNWDKTPAGKKASSRLHWTVAIENFAGEKAPAAEPEKTAAPVLPSPKYSPPAEAPQAAPAAGTKSAAKLESRPTAPEEVAADSEPSARSDGAATLSPPAQVIEAPPAEDAPGSVPIDHVAVLELGDGGEILGARDACLVLFGWKPRTLVGKNICMLLKDGLDNEVGRFLQRHREGSNPIGTGPLRVVALRKDGTEFPAQVTTRHWSWDKSSADKKATSRLNWTVAIESFAGEKAPVPEPEKTEAPASPESSPPRAAAQAESATEHLITFDLKLRIQNLESQLNQTNHDLGAATAVIETLGSRNSELLAQIENAKATTNSAASDLKEETARREKLEKRLKILSNRLRLEQAERSQRFEKEIVSLQQERDRLNEKLELEQRGASDSTQRLKELETCLSRNAVEFEQVKTELQRQAAEHERSESSWRERMDTAIIAKKELEGAWTGAIESNKRLEEELAKIRKEHDKLNERLMAEQKTAAESKRRAQEVENSLVRNAANSDEARARLQKLNTQREQADGEWREQLEAEKAIRAALEGSLAEATERIKRLDHDSEVLQRERDELRKQLLAEQQATQDRIRKLEADGTATGDRNQTLETELAGLQERLRKLEADGTAADDRNQTLETELADLHREFDELNRRLAAEQRAVADAERARAKWENQVAERERAEAEMREQLRTTEEHNTSLNQSIAEGVTRIQQLEEELAVFREEREQLLVQVKAEQKRSEESRRRAEQLEHQLEQDAGELERLAADLERREAEHEETQLLIRKQQDSAMTSVRKLEADRAAAVERSVHLENEMASLRHDRDELAVLLKSEQQSSAQAAREAVETQRRLDRLTAELKRISAKAERLREDSERADSEWSEQLDGAKALAAKLETAWTEATERNRQYEEEVMALRQEREELLAQLAAAQPEAVDFDAELQPMAGNGHHLSHERPAGPSQAVGPGRQRSAPSAPVVPQVAMQPTGPNAAQSINPHQTGVIQYSFGDNAEKPVRRKSTPSKKRSS